MVRAVLAVDVVRAELVDAFAELDERDPVAPWSDFADVAMTRIGHFLLAAGAGSPESDVVPIAGEDGWSGTPRGQDLR